MEKRYILTGLCRPEFSGRDHLLTVVVEAENMDAARRKAYRQARAEYDDVSISQAQRVDADHPLIMTAYLPDPT